MACRQRCWPALVADRPSTALLVRVMPLDQAFAWGAAAGSAARLSAGNGLARPDDVRRRFAQQLERAVT